MTAGYIAWRREHRQDGTPHWRLLATGETEAACKYNALTRLAIANDVLPPEVRIRPTDADEMARVIRQIRPAHTSEVRDDAPERHEHITEPSPAVCALDPTDRNSGTASRAAAPREIETQSTTRHSPRSSPSPYLTYGDGELHLQVSPRGLSIDAEIGGTVRRLAPAESSVLSPPWPNQLRWRESAQNSWQSIVLFTDPTASILLFDADSERLKASLNPPHSAHRVKEGSIALVSRNQFRAAEDQAYQLEEGAYVLFHDLTSDMDIRQRDLTFNITVDPSLRLEVDGRRVARHEDGWLLSGSRTVYLRGHLSTTDDLEIEVDHPSIGERFRIPVRRVGDELGAPLHLPDHGPFGMLKISVYLKDQSRAIRRERLWHWPGLAALRPDGGFDASNIPANLAKEHLVQVIRDDDGLLRLSTRTVYLQGRLAFVVDGEIISFTFPPPGISMLERTSSAEESPLEIGSRLEITPDRYASQLVIRCPDHLVSIDFMGEVIRQPFNKHGVWRMSFAALASVRQGRKRNAIRLLTPGGSGIDLIRIGTQKRAEPEVQNRQYFEEDQFSTLVHEHVRWKPFREASAARLRWQFLRVSRERRIPIQGIIRRKVDGGYDVDLGEGIRGFAPSTSIECNASDSLYLNSFFVDQLFSDRHSHVVLRIKKDPY